MKNLSQLRTLVTIYLLQMGTGFYIFFNILFKNFLSTILYLNQKKYA